MSEKILVTGATGKVGAQLVKTLSALGIPTRAGVRDLKRGRELFGDKVELARFDFEDAESIRQALDGVQKLALITPPSDRQVDWAALTIDLAKQAGVRHVVRLSVLAAAMEPGIQLARWHRIAERYLQASGLEWTIIRPGPFMQNFLGLYPSQQGQFNVPLGAAKINHIDVADVAQVLATVLSQDGHEGKIHMVTGPEALSMEEATRILSESSGKRFGYHDTPAPQAKEAMLGAGRPAWLTDIVLELFAAFRTGAVAAQLPTFKDLTGREARRFENFAASM